MEKSDDSILAIELEESATAQFVKTKSISTLSFPNSLRSMVRKRSTSNRSSLSQINEKKTTAMIDHNDTSLKTSYFLPHQPSTSTIGRNFDPSATHSATLPKRPFGIGESASALLGDHFEINNSDFSSDDSDGVEELKENKKDAKLVERGGFKSTLETENIPSKKENNRNANILSQDANLPKVKTDQSNIQVQPHTQKNSKNGIVDFDTFGENANHSDDESDKIPPKHLAQNYLHKRISKNDIENLPIKEGLKAQNVNFARGKRPSESSNNPISEQNQITFKPPQIQKKQESLDLAKDNISNASNVDPFHLLIKAIFAHDIPQIENLLAKYPTLNINMADKLGNTPLTLTSKLAYRHLDYFEIAEILLEKGADAKIRDRSGWSCVDEAVGQADAMMLSLLFDYMIQAKQKVLKDQQANLIKVLDSMPNFYLEMKWDFDSSVLPFISKLAPSDTFKIWKFGRYLRMDNTLVGFKKLKVKRRNMSLIFNPDIPLTEKCKSQLALFSLNRTKNTYTNLLEEMDLEEKKNIMCDFMKADPLQGSFNIKDCQFSESKGLFGGNTAYKISGYETAKYDFKITMEYVVFKKSQAFFKDTYQTYMDKMNAESPDFKDSVEPRNPNVLFKQLREKNDTEGGSSNTGQTSASAAAKNKQLKDVLNLERLKEKAVDFNTIENAKVSEKKGNASIWFAKNFPLQIRDLLQALQFLSKGNDLLQKMDSLLSKQEVKDLTADGAFPMKLQLPITMSIKANITITKYEVLQDIDDKNIFFIPEDLTYMPRKEAQKTPLRKKKRLLLFGMLT